MSRKKKNSGATSRSPQGKQPAIKEEDKKEPEDASGQAWLERYWQAMDDAAEMAGRPDYRAPKLAKQVRQEARAAKLERHALSSKATLASLYLSIVRGHPFTLTRNTTTDLYKSLGQLRGRMDIRLQKLLELEARTKELGRRYEAMIKEGEELMQLALSTSLLER
ncbi:hypothetical protein I317_07261 [Kwoniella heveanensis CBS 569]|nr:hypothetical protein I317_07261 [Kwoniella heveanensis CBS 569]